MESSLKKLNQQERKYTKELDAALAQYDELRQQAENMDVVELDTVRQSIRPDMEHEATQRLQGAYGKPVDTQILTQSHRDVTDLLDEASEPVSVYHKLRQPRTQQAKRYHTKSNNHER